MSAGFIWPSKSKQQTKTEETIRQAAVPAPPPVQNGRERVTYRQKSEVESSDLLRTNLDLHGVAYTANTKSIDRLDSIEPIDESSTAAPAAQNSSQAKLSANHKQQPESNSIDHLDEYYETNEYYEDEKPATEND